MLVTHIPSHSHREQCPGGSTSGTANEKEKRREGQSEREMMKERREGWTRDGYSCPGMPATIQAKRNDASCRGGHTFNGNMEDVETISSQNSESREGVLRMSISASAITQ